MVADEEDGELLLLSKEEMQGCLDAFYELFDRNAFDPETNTTREGASVLGHDLRNNVQELMAAQTEALRVMTKVQNGETFNAKDGAEAVRVRCCLLRIYMPAIDRSLSDCRCDVRRPTQRRCGRSLLKQTLSPAHCRCVCYRHSSPSHIS